MYLSLLLHKLMVNFDPPSPTRPSDHLAVQVISGRHLVLRFQSNVAMLHLLSVHDEGPILDARFVRGLATHKQEVGGGVESLHQYA